MKKICLVLVALMLVLCDGCMYLVDGYCIIHDGRAYEYMYNNHWSCKDAWDLPASEKYEDSVYYGFKNIPKRNKESAYFFKEKGLDMFLVGEDGELYGDRDFNWPNVEKSQIKTITVELYEESPIDMDSGVEWSNSQLEITNVNDIRIVTADLSNARHAGNWRKDAPSDTAVLAGPIEIQFYSFKPTFHYGYICKSTIGWYLLGAWQTDIDDYYSIEQKMFLLSSDVQRKLNQYLNETS